MYKFISLILLLVGSLTFSYANSTSNNTVSIQSNNQELEQLGDGNLRSVFVGNVVVIYNKTTTIRADRVVASNINGKRTIVATGNNVVLTNQQREFRLDCRELTFDVNSGVVTAINGTAVLQTNNISGNVLIYNVNTGNITAKGSSSTQVKTILNSSSSSNK
ncbi:hypothetical protein CKF54_06605 [Psittacicella hinzii]|uniref:Uncharacterized protein n=1 Tax=Psittacicella hinzii TaxID=2028575 RepID=A0A3A1Y260_9GAMM|nr:LptA/OstA family protein [Psittacicella hinzii]RIY31500.1 hypothetical protein CKF54_06605 [Psittacicella hinzii]